MIRIRSSANSISLLLIIFTISVVHVNQYLLWTSCVAVVLVFIVSNKGRLRIAKMPGGFCVWTLIAIGICGGLLALVQYKTSLWPIARDIIRATIFPFAWAAFSMLVYQHRDYSRETFYRNLFVICGFCSIIDLIVSLPARIAQMGNGFSAFAEAFSPDKYLIAVGLFFVLFKPLPHFQSYISKRIDFTMKVAIVINFALAFSRTAILTAILIAVPFFAQHVGKFIKLILGIILLLLILSFVMPETTSYFVYKIFHSLQEIGYNGAWTNTAVVSNWRGYEIHCAQQHFGESNLFYKFFGDGYGAYLDVGRFAFLVTSEKAIPFLHNGYYTALLKTGAMGVILNLLYYIINFCVAPRRIKNTFDRKFVMGIVLSMAFSAWTVGGVLIGYMIPLYALILVWLPYCRENQKAGEKRPVL